MRRMRRIPDMTAQLLQRVVQHVPDAERTYDFSIVEDPKLVRTYESLRDVPPLRTFVHQIDVGVGIRMRDLLTPVFPFVLAGGHERIAHAYERRHEIVIRPG